MPHDDFEPSPLFTFELTLQAGDFQAEWKRCNMLANYIAEYVAYQFNQQERVENIISTIANELLEAIVRLAPAQTPLHIRCLQFENGLQLDTEHGIRAEAMQPYQMFLKDLLTEDIDQLYLDLLTTEDEPIEYFNQLGLVMIPHDFGVKLTSYQLENADRICTHIFVSTEELSA
jgi:hypothetical protein